MIRRWWRRQRRARASFLLERLPFDERVVVIELARTNMREQQ